jgi:outer membrane receptor protein involved in Fe transport
MSQVLTTIPSIDIENGQITVRGRTLNEVAFVVDGARARNPLNHDPYTRINLSAVQDLEVITGTFNAEYGEAQSGVINVITKEGRRDRYELFVDTRFTPPGVQHWGTPFYDQSASVYWENTHARHLDWWIENTDQWVDLNGVPGSDPRNAWTPEEAYEYYMQTHQPLSDYTQAPTYQVEVGLGGPTQIGRSTFYGTLKYRSQPPLYGNAYRDRGEYIDGNLKVAVPLGGGRKLVASGFYGQEETGWGFYNDPFWALEYGQRARYAHYDFPGLPFSVTNGLNLHYSQALSSATLYEVRLARVQGIRRATPFPSDPMCFAPLEEEPPPGRPNQACFRAESPTESIVRSPDPGGNFANPVGHNTTGYYFQYDSDNTEWTLEADISSQLNRTFAVKAGAEFSTYRLEFFNQAKFPDRFDEGVYRPYQGAAYAQTKVEHGGLIVNAGLRLDFYNANDTLYTNVFEPLADPGDREPTQLFAQLSPRLGVSHPIDDRTKLHFSYGHFFQRPPFNAYGEGNDGVTGSLNTFITEDGTPWVLGNRDLRPQRTVAYEVGVERNFWDVFLLTVNGYYKDIRNTIRMVTVQIPGGGQYRTTANADYADHSGVEFSLRKVPATYGFGTVSAYVNYTSQFGMSGRSSVPIHRDPDPGLNRYDNRDNVHYQNPRIKLGLYYQTPTDWRGTVGDVLGGISVALDYRANFPNPNLRQDFFAFGGVDHLRPVDQMADLRLRKEIALPRGMGALSPYVEVSNLLNQRWIFFPAIERASLADQGRFVESRFRELPVADAQGAPFLDLALYRNLPRTFVFGVTLQY